MSRNMASACLVVTGKGMPMQVAYAPLRTLQDVQELERVPLEERILRGHV
jgi:hypothetical protein